MSPPRIRLLSHKDLNWVGRFLISAVLTGLLGWAFNVTRNGVWLVVFLIAFPFVMWLVETVIKEGKEAPPR